MKAPSFWTAFAVPAPPLPLQRNWGAAGLWRISTRAHSDNHQKIAGCYPRENSDLVEKNGRGLIHYRVNNYDSDAANQNERKRIIVSKYGVQTDRKDLFFDGVVGDGQLAKIVDLNKPLTQLDIQIIKDEIAQNRPDETRDITVFATARNWELWKNLPGRKTQSIQSPSETFSRME